MTLKGKNTRVSFAIPKKELDKLYEIATDKRVSVSWVMREAVTCYLTQKDKSK